MAKPKPMVPAKATHRQLGVTPVKREGQSSAGFGISGSQTSTRRLLRTTQSPEIECSQLRRQEKETCTGSDSKSRVSNHEVHKKSKQDEGLSFPAKEVGDYSRTLNISNGSIEDKCVAVGNVHVFVNESIPFILDRIILANLKVYKNTNFEEIQSLVNITQKLIFGVF